MSIATELTNLAANRDAIKAAIEAKNPATAPTSALSSFPVAIASIPTGGGSSTLPLAGMPNIKQLLTDDEEDYEYKVYILFDTVAGPTVTNVLSRMGATKAVTSDGVTYTSNATHTWDATKYINGRYGWIAYYSATGFTSCRWDRNYSGPDNLVLWIVGNKAISSSEGIEAMNLTYQWGVMEVDFPSIAYTTTYHNYGASRKFFNCYSLKSIPAIDISSQQNVNTMFAGCSSLSRLPDVLDLSNATNVNGLYFACYALARVPDVVNLGNVTSANNQSNMFYQCYSLRALPTHVTSNWSLSFSSCKGVTDKSSVATFDDATNPTAVTGGFVGNLNTCPNSGQTITLNSAIKGLFDATTEQPLIEAALNAKNWTLSW